MKTKRICQICFSLDQKLLISQKFSTIGNTDLSYNVVICKRCGFIFSSNMPSEKDLTEYYKSLNRYEGVEGGGVTSNTKNAHSRVVRFLRKYLKFKNLSIFDIGCSTGNLLNAFKEKGFAHVSGLDPSTSCKKIAKKLYGINIFTGVLSEYFSQEKYDVVLLSHVLEHLPDLPATFTKLNNLTNDNSLLYVEVPAAHKFNMNIKEPFSHFSIEHINFFTEKSLKNLMNVHGFENVYMKTALNRRNYFPHFPVIMSVWRKTGKKHKVFPDYDARKIMDFYIERSNKKMEKLDTIISNIHSLGKPIIIWGAGSHTMKLMARTKLASVPVDSIVDRNKTLWGKKCCGIKVEDPEILKSKNIPILISTSAYQDEIKKYIKNTLKLPNKIITLY